MSTQTGLAVAAMTLSIASVVLSGWFTNRSIKIRHELEDQRERDLRQATAQEAAGRVYEPLAQAAAELQSRIYNIVRTGWVPLVERYQSHGDYVVTSTSFLFAHYFGWIEARRQVVLSSSGEGDRDPRVSKLIHAVRSTLRESQYDEGFLFFNVEQRAIGELMFSWDVIEDIGRLPRVMGYAEFVAKFEKDESFRRWFKPVVAGIEHIAESENYGRLIEIHAELIALIKELDPKNRYTTRYELRQISPES
ncbi:hypothetical protein ABIE44_001792 [Marmoricola sp. OAE513]|uniref:hypothetical protein n=1 Tax=Marmoricola sp. OAE513 TaxID=2817894 RepID=UPI001AE7DAE3